MALEAILAMRPENGVLVTGFACRTRRFEDVWLVAGATFLMGCRASGHDNSRYRCVAALAALPREWRGMRCVTRGAIAMRCDRGATRDGELGLVTGSAGLSTHLVQMRIVASGTSFMSVTGVRRVARYAVLRGCFRTMSLMATQAVGVLLGLPRGYLFLLNLMTTCAASRVDGKAMSNVASGAIGVVSGKLRLRLLRQAILMAFEAKIRCFRARAVDLMALSASLMTFNARLRVLLDYAAVTVVAVGALPPLVWIRLVRIVTESAGVYVAMDEIRRDGLSVGCSERLGLVGAGMTSRATGSKNLRPTRIG